jgi:hypothetical protein
MENKPPITLILNRNTVESYFMKNNISVDFGLLELDIHETVIRTRHPMAKTVVDMGEGEYNREGSIYRSAYLDKLIPENKLIFAYVHGKGVRIGEYGGFKSLEELSKSLEELG